ncbi:hypothetical protein BC628DRAFT_1357225, partial [Trametes gibbosa]
MPFSFLHCPRLPPSSLLPQRQETNKCTLPPPFESYFTTHVYATFFLANIYLRPERLPGLLDEGHIGGACKGLVSIADRHIDAASEKLDIEEKRGKATRVRRRCARCLTRYPLTTEPSVWLL